MCTCKPYSHERTWHLPVKRSKNIVQIHKKERKSTDISRKWSSYILFQIFIHSSENRIEKWRETKLDERKFASFRLSLYPRHSLVVVRKQLNHSKFVWKLLKFTVWAIAVSFCEAFRGFSVSKAGRELQTREFQRNLPSSKACWNCPLNHWLFNQI